ncbi:MAG: YfdX family protein [Candidatus Nitrosocosmicus sp.]|nr:YfdX family protein [Candidatus Nitrosocosmicus sp.]
MKLNKNAVCISILLIFGTTIGGLLALGPSQIVWASIVEGSNTSNFSQEGAGGCNPYDCQEAVNHINEAKSSLQNGDTEGAQKHLDLAKQSLGCNPITDPRC